MKIRYKGLLIALFLMILVSIFNAAFLELRNKNYQTEQFQQWGSCQQKIYNQFGEYNYDVTPPKWNYPLVLETCGNVPGENIEKYFNFIQGIWGFIFDSIFGPIIPLCFLLIGYAIGYWVEIKKLKAARVNDQLMDAELINSKMTYLKYGGIGVLLGLIPVVLSAIDKGSLNSILGWFYNAPIFILSSITPCSGEECLSYFVLGWLFWEVIGLSFGLLIAKRKNKLNDIK